MIYFHPITRRARKPHKCEECSTLIGVAAEYVRVSGVDDAGVFSYAFCVECDRLWQTVPESLGDDRPIIGELRQWLADA